MNLSRVLIDNYNLHQREAPFYDRMHPEIFNWYEQRQINNDIHLILNMSAPTILSVLDLGCGTGNIAIRFLRQGHRVDCVDLSDEMLKIIRKKTDNMDNARFFMSDADTFLRDSASYDVICLSSVLHHLPDFNQTLMLCSQKLNLGGFLYITHEPLPRAERLQPARIQNLLSWFGWKKFNGLKRLFGKKFPQLDYGTSDIHVDEGISPETLLTQLNVYGLELVLLRKYRAEPSAVLAWVNNVLLPGHPMNFTLLCRIN